MKYSINELAKQYIHYLSEYSFDVNSPAQSFDYSTYNEYTYEKLMQQYDLLYEHADSVELTEDFLKGD